MTWSISEGRKDRKQIFYFVWPNNACADIIPSTLALNNKFRAINKIYTNIKVSRAYTYSIMLNANYTKASLLH